MRATLSFLLRPALRSIALICALWLMAPTATMAQSISCSSSMSNDLVFTNVVPWRASPSTSATITVTCSNSAWFTTYRVAVCLSIGTGSAGNTSDWNPKKMSSGTNMLDFAILQPGGSPFGSYFWSGSSVNLPVMTVSPSSSESRTVTVTSSLNGGQDTAPPGTYQSSFPPGHTAMAVASSASLIGSPSCAGQSPSSVNSFSFIARAQIPAFCEINSTIADMNFGPVDGLFDTSKTANTSITVRCTNTTPYRINLTPSNGNNNGVGQMSFQGSGSTDKVPYALFQDGSTNTPWGNQVSNAKTGTGTGREQAVSVFGSVPANLNVTPGNYRDTVTVTVTY